MRMHMVQGYTSQACLRRQPHQKNEDCTRPMVAVSQPNCLDIGRIAMLMFTRSMLHSMNATKHSPTIVKRRCHPERCTASTTYQAMRQGIQTPDGQCTHCCKASLTAGELRH